MTTTPIYGVTDWAAAQASPWLARNAASRIHEAVMRGSVLDRDLTAPPGTCADGAAYLVDATATGAWAGMDGLMAIANGANAASGWLYADIACEGFLLYVEDEAALLQYVSAAWAAFAGGGGSGTETWDFNFADAGDAYILASEAMTITEQDTTGTGILAYEKSTNAAPDTFASTTSPVTLEAGAKLKVSASSVTPTYAVHLARTA